MIPIRIQRSRRYKQESPNGLQIQYCGRGSKWGNPFRVVKLYDGKWGVKVDDPELFGILAQNCHAAYSSKQDAQLDAVKCYEAMWLPYTRGGSLKDLLITEENIRYIQKELKNKNLSCWCGLDEPCHADWLLKLANE